MNLPQKMARRLQWTAVFSALLFWIGTDGGRIDGVCTDVNPLLGQPERPKLPFAQFYVHVECNFMLANQTVLVTEWYDENSNFGRVHQREDFQDGDMYFDYDHNQLITVDRDSGECTVEPLASSSDRFLFGVNKTSGQDRIYTTSGALHFGDAPELYVGTKTVRGIPTDVWRSCQYSSVLDATMQVYWHFSVEGSWDTQLGVGSLPVRAHVVGKRNDVGGGSHSFEHIYEFFDFFPTVSPRNFELHSGRYCPGRYNQKPLPGLPNVFTIIGERLDFDSNIAETIEEHYDKERKVNVYRYKDTSFRGLLAGQNGKLQINDFNEGYAYVIDEKTRHCDIHLISEGRFAYVSTGNTVRQQTPLEFYLADNVNFQYQGLKTERGFHVDSFVGISNHTPGYMGRDVILEWYFMKDYSDWNGLYDGIPLALRMWKHKDDDVPIYTYNAFGFSHDRPRVINLDISPCFSGAARAEVQVSFDGQNATSVKKNVESFKASFMQSLSLFLGISPLRISDIKLYFTAYTLEMVFDLLDKPQFQGDVSSPLVQNSLQNALHLLNSSVVESDVQIDFVAGDQVFMLAPLKQSWRFFQNGTCSGHCDFTYQPFSNPQSGGTGYSAGALAGLGVAMLVVGGLIGSGSTFQVLRSRQ